MASLKKNVEQLTRTRGLSRAQLGARVGMDDADFEAFLQDPPKRSAKFKQIARELLVPDFFLLADSPPVREQGLTDFRLSHPTKAGYSRETLKWMDFATAVQEQSKHFPPGPRRRSIRDVINRNVPIARAATAFRTTLKITDADQMAAADARVFYAEVRKRVEDLNVFVLQLSFPEADGAGFCLADDPYDVIVLNTHGQSPARRLFTLAHEIYHCALRASGVSDPDVVHNATERKCNQFAVHFIAPDSLVNAAAQRCITSRSFNIADIKKFSNLTKLSLHASVLRLVEMEIYEERAIAAWTRFIKAHGNLDKKGGGGGKRVDEWKYKLSRYGFQFARVFGAASGRNDLDPLDMYHFSGIRPKYQKAYFSNAVAARAEDAEDDDGQADG